LALWKQSLKTAIVHTKTDNTIRGLISEVTKDYIVLRPASIAGTDLATGNITWTKLDGDIVIPLSNVDFYQEGVEASIAGVFTELI